MVASKYYKEHKDSNTFSVSGEISEKSFPRLLKSAVIYGPNASGKTSLVEAMNFAEYMVCRSLQVGQVGDEIDVYPFKLSKETRNADSEFEVVFIEEGVRYQFGFAVNTSRITSEWLYAYPEGHMQKWYFRQYDPFADEYFYHYSKHFLGGRRKRDWEENTRHNTLYISTAVQLNNEQLRPAFNWFNARLATIDPVRLSKSFTMSRLDKKKGAILDFLSSADLSIADVVVQRRIFDPAEVPDAMPSQLKDEVIRTMTGKELAEPKFYSRSIDDDSLVEFDEDEVSAGTKALFSFSGPWVDFIENDRVLFIDELDTSLHPLVVHQIVRILHTLGCRSQLIFTTHDTSILGQNILRRDQVWLIEKDDTQSTVLTPLSDYSVREDEALERGYLAGRYGAVPFLKEVENEW